MTKLSRRNFLKLTAAGAASAVGGTLGYGYWNIRRFERTWHRVELAGLTRPLTVVQLTDLHAGPFVGTAQVRAWVEAAMTEGADLIVLTGDVVDYRFDGSLPALAEALSDLSAPLGVFSVWGNHDHIRFGDHTDPRNHTIAPLQEALDSIGVRTLQNEWAAVRDDLTLIGLDDFTHGLPRSRLDKMLARIDAPHASLALSHNPDALPRVPEWIGLTLCGHTHGGQVRLPLIGAPVTSSRYGQRFLEGWVSGPARGYVSRGLGVSLLPLRINCPAELSVFEFVPAA